MKKRTLFLVILSIFLLVTAASQLVRNVPRVEAKQTSTKITGKINNQRTANICHQLLQQNLKAATDKNLNDYLATLVKDAHKATTKEMQQFFKDYDVSHELLSFEVIKQAPQSMLVAAEQKTVNHGKKAYRDHITTAYHTFILEENEWKIKETTMTNTQFLN
ncbi:hypothetical protein EFL14_RS11245 [Enterococcus hirae]|uniref:hypothetical protein n=1 Tax=Enterococcus sp. C63 TaxID=3231324 RepID=UPI001A057F74|nr:hypothetical protein [Enterococcus hirae]EMF0131155.1 hypothetical protein [Enterococcus hirae]EMF0449394.1 hypothetical protein [Enterococcus hirae]EMF0515303.1 hypothetical protein [Enterococcus hirae]EMF0520213.1 hypothetical protein [Enterococcus hirae]